MNYRETSIEKYQEEDIKNEGFNFLVEEQKLRSFEGVIGIKLQYTLTPSYAVFIPYLEAQYHKEYNDDVNVIKARYENIAEISLNPDASFQLSSNKPEKDYSTITIGVSSILSGSQDISADGKASGGIQAYASASAIEGISKYQQYSAAAGLRYEF